MNHQAGRFFLGFKIDCFVIVVIVVLILRVLYLYCVRSELLIFNTIDSSRASFVSKEKDIYGVRDREA